MSSSKNFKYLDDLIHSGAKEIVLDSDIALGDGEESEYRDGIILFWHGLTIDGNGHTVDARSKARIFHCMGENITIKNIVLKNGYAEEDHSSGGGAILNTGKLTICDSTFTGNTVRDSGKAYPDFEYVAYCESGGGAIYNDGELTVIRSTFNNNSVEVYSGGAINNGRDAMLTIQDSTFTANTALDDDGGSIHGWLGDLTIIRSSINGNTAQSCGGAISSSGRLTIHDSTLNNNTAGCSGGAIFHEEDCKLTITGSTLNYNKARFSEVILSLSPDTTITDSILNNKMVK